MPESVLFDKVLRGRPPTGEEWLKLIQERVDLVLSSMDRVRLTKLQDFGYRPSDLGGGCTVSIIGASDDRTSVVRGSFELHDAGIFLSLNSRRRTSPDVHHFLGLMRSGDWRLTTVREEVVEHSVRIAWLEIKRIWLNEVRDQFRIDYAQIMAFLSREYAGWFARKEEQLKRMRGIHNRFVQDDCILDALCDPRS